MNPPEQIPSSPSPFNNEPGFEQMLRAVAPRYIDDAGFTSQVLSALPQARRSAETRRLVLISCAALLGTGITLFLAGNQLIGFGALLAGHFAKWGALPVPGFGPTITVATAAVAIAISAGGWWGLARSH
jgi:hypothetical protein